LGVKGKIVKNIIVQELTSNVSNGTYSLSIEADIP